MFILNRERVIAIGLAGLLVAVAVPTSAGAKGDKPVNLNTASADQLVALDGIGNVLAQRIIEYRQEHDGFSSVAELEEVTGIGEHTRQSLAGQVVVGEHATTD